MAHTILKPAVQATLSDFHQSGAPILANLTETSTIPTQIQQWLASLKLLHHVPFRYLVPDDRMLPAESIRFFHVDINWLNALVDGAYSIGRYGSSDSDSSFYNKVEAAMAEKLHRSVNLAARNKRPALFKATGNGSNEEFEVVTGFLLRSQVVKGWPGLQVNAYSKSNYPELPNWDGTSLPCLRFEHLSEEVLIGFFEGETYRLDIHEPSEGLHFGFDTELNNGIDQLSKKLRNTETGEKLGSISNAELVNAQVFRNNGTPEKGNEGGQVVNLYNLSVLMYQKLQGTPVAPKYLQPAASVLQNKVATPVSGLTSNMNALVSSDFALQMVEGVGMVSFYNSSPGDPIQCL